jgi:O-antigen ligase
MSAFPAAASVSSSAPTTSARGLDGPWAARVGYAVLAASVVGARVHESVTPLAWLRPALLLMAIGAVAFVRLPASVTRRVTHDVIFRLTVAYVVWAAITVPGALYRSLAISFVQGLLSVVFIVGAFLVCPPTFRTLDRLQLGVVVGVLVTAATSLVHNRLTRDGRLTQGGTLDPNDLAAVCGIALVLALGLLIRLRGHWVQRALLIVTVGVLGLTVARTGSRGGFFALGVSTIVLVVALRGAWRWLALAFAVVASLGLWRVAGENFQTRVGALFSGETDYNYTEYGGRKQIWARARGYVVRHPVFGVGVGNFSVAEGNTCRVRAPNGGCPWMAPHSSYWQAAAEMGVPGVAIFVGLLVAAGRAAFRLWRPPPRAPSAYHRPELFAALLGFLVSAAFLSHAYLAELFVLLGLIALTKFVVETGQSPSGAPSVVPSGGPAWQRTARAVRRPGRRGGLAVTP